jgi:predicted amidohydrolase YtcJ
MATRTVNEQTMDSAGDTSRSATIGATVSDAAGTARGVAADAVSRFPEVAATTRATIEETNRQIQAGSDEMLTMGSVLSFGFAMGLLIGGAGRLLVAAALLPAAVMGITLFDRMSRTRGAAGRRLQGG